MILTACWQAVNHIQIRSPEAVHMAWWMQRWLDSSLMGGQDDSWGPPLAAGARKGSLHECQFVLGPSLHVVPSVFNVFYRSGDLADWRDLSGYVFPDLVPVSMRQTHCLPPKQHGFISGHLSDQNVQFFLGKLGLPLSFSHVPWVEHPTKHNWVKGNQHKASPSIQQLDQCCTWAEEFGGIELPPTCNNLSFLSIVPWKGSHFVFKKQLSSLKKNNKQQQKTNTKRDQYERAFLALQLKWNLTAWCCSICMRISVLPHYKLLQIVYRKKKKQDDFQLNSWISFYGDNAWKQISEEM